MGTRSLTILHETIMNGQTTEFEGQEIVVLYRQFDGYLSGHGKELKEFLSDFTIVNGISSVEDKIANGGGCLAAQIVKHFKDDIGNIYLHSAGTRDIWEEYRYYVYPFIFGDRNGITVLVESGYGDKWEVIYEGKIEKMPITD
ncbi:MAG: hypothetical protein ACXAC2_17745 [Candidatus Kariarchaeaceae archaeon]